MTTNSNSRDEIELNDDELNLVVGGGWGAGWTYDFGTASLVNPRLLSAADKLSAIQPIHLPPVHTAVPH